jgi:hypothetical protein
MLLTTDQLAALAQTNATNRAIESTLGRPMTADERGLVDRARLVRDLRRQQKRGEQKQSSAQRNRKLSDASHVLLIPALTPEQKRTRTRLEKDTADWLRHFFPGIYRHPFGAVHHEIIAASEYTITHAGRCVVAAPRGTGKSYVLAGVALKAMFCGRVRFPVVIPWDAKALKKTLSFWKKALCFNEELAALYPEFCAPFRAARGVSQRVGSFTDAEGTQYGAQLLISEGMIVLPSSRGVIGGATINGNPLGLHHTTDDGQGLRPDLIFIDDPQDRETALSRYQIDATIELIDFDIAGMAGPDVAMPMLMACTVKKRGDVAEHYLDGGAWRAVRVGQIVTWPDKFDDKASPARAAWEAWDVVRLDGEQAKDGGKAERAYYRAHKATMTAGMSVSWDHRYVKESTPDQPKQPDALYAAMADYYRMGHGAFMAERQNEPLEATAGQYELTVPTICHHTLDLPRLQLPTATTVFVGSCDINRAGLHWCLAGFDQSMTGHCPAYGKHPARGDLWPENAPAQVMQVAIFTGLKALCDQIEAAAFRRGNDPAKPSLLFIDAGFESNTVHAFCERARYSFKVVPSIGRAAHKYRWAAATLVGRPFDGGHMQRPAARAYPYCMFNADKWREIAQRAFLGVAGQPGGFTLHAVDDPHKHAAFAEHVSAEKLTNKYESDAGWRWEYQHAPGSHWDWGDALTGCWVAAAACGLSIGGESFGAVKRTTGKCSVVISRPSQRR